MRLGNQAPRAILVKRLMNVRVKICGITNLRDALAAIDAGADALGFMFCQASPRYLTSTAAASIIKELPPFVRAVGVFADATEEHVRSIIEECGVDTLQFHGGEQPGFCRRFQVRTIKAFRVRDEGSLKEMAQYGMSTWLLDSYVPGKLGGTGEKFNWELARRATQLNGRVILAGGLTPANVAEAVRQVHPYAVDVSSGVETAPGQKDHQKVRDFIAAAKSARS
jgi:phosphoribosylanthranilate isomerase